MLLIVRSGPRRRWPRAVHPLWLYGIALPTGVAAWPFWALWHPLGYAVAVVVYAFLWLCLVVSDRRRGRRVGAYAVASARVRSPRG